MSMGVVEGVGSIKAECNRQALKANMEPKVDLVAAILFMVVHLCTVVKLHSMKLARRRWHSTLSMLLRRRLQTEL